MKVCTSITTKLEETGRGSGMEVGSGGASLEKENSWEKKQGKFLQLESNAGRVMGNPAEKTSKDSL